MKIGIVLYPTYGGSGVVATELGKLLAKKNHEIHFITYSQPVRLGSFDENLFIFLLGKLFLDQTASRELIIFLICSFLCFGVTVILSLSKPFGTVG